MEGSDEGNALEGKAIQLRKRKGKVRLDKLIGGESGWL